MSVETKKSSVVPYIHLAIILLIMFGFKYLPPFLAITPQGMAVLGVFLGWLYGICTFDMCLTCLLGFIAVCFTGVIGINDYYVGGFGNNIFVLLTFSMMFIGGLVKEYNLTDLMLSKMFSIKMLYGRPWIFSVGFVLLGFIVCTFTNPYIVVLVLYKMLADICKTTGIKPYSAWPSMMMIALTVAASISIINMPYKATTLIFMGIFANATGSAISWGGFTLLINLIAIVGLTVYILACRIIFSPDVSALAGLTADSFGEAKAATKAQKAAAWMMAAFVVSLLGSSLVPATTKIGSWIAAVGMPGIVMLLIVIGACIKIDGKPLIDFMAVARDGIQWNVFLIIAFSLPLMTMLTNNDTGITASLMQILTPLLSGHSALTFIIIALIVAILLTNVFNNMVVIMIMLPILCQYAVGMGINASSLIVLLIFCGYLAILFPAGSPLTAIMFGHKEYINMKTALIYGSIALVILSVIMFAIGYPLGTVLL